MFVNRRALFLSFFILPVIIFLFPIFLSANFVSDIIINETAWMGTESSANSEWVELYNNSDQPVDLTNWTLTAADGTPSVVLSGIIPAKGYFILERTSDETLPAVIADQIYTGAFSNSGENLELKNSSGDLIDALNCSSGWFAGDNTTKQTMERKDSSIAGNDSNNWQSSQNPGGTPKEANSQGAPAIEEHQSTDEESISSTPASTPSVSSNHPPKAEAGADVIALVNQEITFDASKSSDQDNNQLTFLWNFGDGQTSSQAKAAHQYQFPGKYIVNLTASDGKTSSSDSLIATIYSNTIIISEFLPNPEGKDNENEWIELYNNSNQATDLSSWQIDTGEKSKPFIFPANTSFAARQYLILTHPTTKLSLNNASGKIRLLYPTAQISQEIKYDKAPQGQSVSLISGNEYAWSAIPTPGLSNIISNATNKTASSLNSLAVEATDYYNPISTIIPSNPTLIPSQPQSSRAPINNISASPTAANVAAVDNMGTKQESANNPSLAKNENKPQNQTASLTNKFSSPAFLIVIIIILGFATGLGLMIIRRKIKRL